jgi:hypothetical protein
MFAKASAKNPAGASLAVQVTALRWHCRQCGLKNTFQ